ncbi:MAG TPA: hypothetical protein VKV04_13415 [Verrucomicrobiae bacterium]|nr:hypothetical protein [Verrucomicrobiae bacterium]
MNSDKIKEKAEDLQEQAAEAARSFKERAADWQDSARENITTFAKNTHTYVHENPWPAIGITAVFAFALGLMVGGRRR